MKTYAPKPLKNLALVSIVLLSLTNTNAQNTVVTDSAAYNAEASAVLDVQSVHKGFLVPRMTTSQREDISDPAEGLLVFDVSLHEFYVYKNSSWQSIAASPLWFTNNDSVYVTGDGLRVGVGTKSPMGRFIIQGDSTAANEPLFEVKNSDGQSIFAVYEDSVTINFIETSKGVKGGFAVGGLTPGKSTPRDYLRITPDSVRIYVDTSQAKGVKGGFAVGGLTPGKGSAIDLMKVTSDSVRMYINDNLSKGVKGGFAVGGLTPGKSTGNQYFSINPDSARIYVKDGAKGVKGGFAVGGLTPGKGVTDHYLTIERDSARIFVENSSKGVKGGFAVGGLTPGKDDARNFMSLTPDNYFIGDSTGINIATGLKNSVFGHAAAYSLDSGSYNILVGFQAGFENQKGNNNTFIGYQSGFNNKGDYNTFLGYQAGYGGLLSGDNNVFIGNRTGASNRLGYDNVFIGNEAGTSNTGGDENVFIGLQSGYTNTQGLSNVFMGYKAGYKNINGDRNVVIGTEAGYTNESNGNVFLGWSSGYSNLTGSSNVAIGQSAGYYNSSGSYNVFIGRDAGLAALGDSNIYIGYQTARISGTSSNNIIIGTHAAEMIKGNGNILIGSNAGWASPYVFERNDELFIETEQTNSPLIWGDFANDYLEFNGSVGINHDASGIYSIYVYGNSRFDNEHSGGFAARFFNDGDATTCHGIRIQSGDDAAAGDNHMIKFYDGNETYHGSIVIDDGTVEVMQATKLSDRKDVKSTEKNGLDIIKNLDVVDYKYLEIDGVHTGYDLIKAESVFPEMIHFDQESGSYGITTMKLIPIMNRAIQQQQDQIEKLEVENKQLKSEIDEIKKFIQQLKK